MNAILKYKRVKDLPKTLLDLVDAETIIKCAEQQKCPCHILTNPITGQIEYLFISTEIKEWIEYNLVRIQSGQNFVNLQILNANKHLAKSTDNIPYELSAIKNLYKIDESIFTGSGVYFLCKDGIIKYIGKSVCVSARIATHIFEGHKNFSEIFYITAPTNEIDALEKALIHYFLPEYNSNGRGKLTDAEKETVENILCKTSQLQSA